MKQLKMNEKLTVENPMAEKNKGLQIDFPHLHVHSWVEFVNILDKLEQEKL